MTMEEKLFVIGAGGHAQVVIDAILRSGAKVHGIFDDNINLLGKSIFDVPIIGRIEEAKGYENGKFIVAIGDNKVRMSIVEKLGFSSNSFFTVIHPSAILGKDVEIGVGSMILGGVVINTGTIVGEHCIINTSSSIDHHNKIFNFVHIAPGTHTGGNVEVEEGAFVGIGASIIPGVKIGSWSTVGAGSVVIDDVSAYSTVVGVPAKVIKKEE